MSRNTQVHTINNEAGCYKITIEVLSRYCAIGGTRTIQCKLPGLAVTRYRNSDTSVDGKITR